MIVGIIGAMEVEVTTLLEALGDAKPHALAGSTAYRGLLDGVSVAVIRCGVGKVNAASCTQALISECVVTHVINTGIAGAIDARLDVGDIVVATDFVQHDFDATGVGFEPGQIPALDASTFVADSSLASLALRAARVAAPDVQVLEGRVATGDQFISTDDAKQRIARTFHPACCEMEGAAMAQVAHANGIPFAAIRCISDTADGKAPELYSVFEEQMAHRCAAITRALVGMLSR